MGKNAAQVNNVHWRFGKWQAKDVSDHKSQIRGTGLPRHGPRGGNLFPVPVDPHYIPGSHALGESHGDRPGPAPAVHNMYTKHQMREKCDANLSAERKSKKVCGPRLVPGRVTLFLLPF